MHRKISIFRLRKRWTIEQAQQVYDASLNDLIFHAHITLRKHFDPNRIQASSLINIKKGACYEKCSYCSQSIHFNTNLRTHPLLDVKSVLASARKAKAIGATRFCMVAAWRGPKRKDIAQLVEMVREVKKLGLETCLSAGLLTKEQALELKEAGLEFYNHNIDTSEEYYQKVVKTRRFADRLKTIKNVSEAGIAVCAGGIVGMGESKIDRIKMIVTLSNLNPRPRSVPINLLIRIKGTPLENVEELDRIELVRTIATTRVLIPETYIRLSAGRIHMSDELQALCFFAGVNSFFYGEELLTTPNPDPSADNRLLARLGMSTEKICNA